MALVVYKDLTTGVSWHFDYVGNLERGREAVGYYRDLSGRQAYPLIDSALFLPTTSHLLEHREQRRQGLPGPRFLQGILRFAEELRDVLDVESICQLVQT